MALSVYEALVAQLRLDRFDPVRLRIRNLSNRLILQAERLTKRASFFVNEKVQFFLLKVAMLSRNLTKVYQFRDCPMSHMI